MAKTVEEAIAIAEKYVAARYLGEALDIFRQIATVAPDHLGVLQKIAAISSKLGQKVEAIAAYRKILRIARSSWDTTNASIALAELIFPDDPDSAIEVLRDRFNPNELGESVELSSVLVRLIEWKARQDHGLPVHHATSFAEVPFLYCPMSDLEAYALAAERLREAIPQNSAVHMMEICARLALKDWVAAERAVEGFRRAAPGDARGRMRFGTKASAPTMTLPAVEVVKAFDHQHDTLMVSCDTVYFETFARPLVRSIAAVSPGIDVHVHLMGPDVAPLETIEALPVRLSMSFEDPREFVATTGMDANHYYCAARFIRFAELLEQSDAGLWMTDADALAQSDLRPLFNLQGDAALRIRAGRVEPWNQFSACMVMGRPPARGYFREVANVVKESFPKPWWGVDQFALFSAYLALVRAQELPEMLTLGPEAASLEADEKAYLWFTAGQRRDLLLTGKGKLTGDKTFERFSARYRAFAA